MKGWKETTTGVRTFSKLPKNAQKYIRRIEKTLGIPVDIISTGQRRDELIILNAQF